AADMVSDDQKQQLLSHLRKAQGGADAEPKKITLTRKTTSTIKTTGSSGKAKTVAVEVRKKRTYVKREVLEAEERERQEQERLEAERIAAEEAARKAEEEARRKADEEEARRQREEAERAAMSPEALAEAEERARKAAEEKAKRLHVPKVGGTKKAGDKQPQETAEERAARE